MGIFRRSPSTRSPGSIGFEAAVGIPSEEQHPAGDEERASTLGLRCDHCDSAGRIDMVDAAAGRAYLTCPRCARTWDTDRSGVDQAIGAARVPVSGAQ